VALGALQLRQHSAPYRVRQGDESAVEGIVRRFNHKVEYIGYLKAMQAPP